MADEHAMELLTAAEQALASLPLPPAVGTLPRGAMPVQWEEFAGNAARTELAGGKLVGNETLRLRIELGRAHVGREELLKLRTGSVVPLEDAAADPVDLYADGHLIGRGEVLTIDGKFAVRVVEIISRPGGS